MMTGNGGISVADALALRNSGGTSGDGFGGFGGDNGAWWIIILILLFGRNGWGNNDNGNGGNGGYGPCCTPVTMQGMSDAFNFSQLDNGVRSLANGLCDGFYATNNSINGVLSALQDCCCQTQLGLCQGFNGVNQTIANLGYNMGQSFCGVDKSIGTLGYQTQAGFNALATQLAQCCCDMRYDMASQACDTRNLIQSTTRDIIDSQNANSRAILDFLTQDKIEALRSENQALKFRASQSEQNAFITANQQAQTAELIRRLGADCPSPAYIVQPPTPVNFPLNGCGQVQFSSGCGCGCF